jgi:hypothetical protein
MRIILTLLALFFFLSPKAQTHLPVNNGYIQWSPFNYYHPIPDSSQMNSKWYFSKYAGISAGFGFYNGGSSTFISAPAGLQINRPLNNNLVAFAGVSAAPTFFSFNRSFTDPLLYKSYPGYNPSNAYGFGIGSRVELGLMYINDTKTFSISGSIGIESSSYPVYPTDGMNPNKQSALR